MRLVAVNLALGVCLGSLLACSNAAEPIAGSGGLVVSVSTSGSDLDPDGYAVTVDQGSPQPIGVNGQTSLQGLAIGSHSVALMGLSTNCTTVSPQTATVTAGQTTTLTFLVVCSPLPVTHPAGVVAATAVLSGTPYGIAVSPQGTMYVALIGMTDLQKGDLGSRTFGSLVSVGLTPPHVVISRQNTTAYATLQTGQGVAVVDVATNTLTATIPLASDGFNLLLSADERALYVTTAAGTVYVIDTGTLAVVTTLAIGSAANGLVLSPDGSTVYISSRDAGTITAISTQSNTIVRTYSVGGWPQRLAIAPDGSELYAANEVSGLNVVNVATGAVVSTSFGSPAYGLGSTPDGMYLYVLLPDAGQVRILERASRAAVGTLSVGGRPRNVAFSSDGRKALVTTEQAVVFIE